eukprot:TRINITY_DN22859_c0_g1_i1.p2 TRINITY_DN22859_c0_g1~~TRINITY_DN22859_c0_g1_i1.p2  ORF type:complete len:315 (-),score=-39.65 TRINITY_DN22859_c0_g1_i1:290-1234(-)
MRYFHDTNINFLGARKIFVWFSLALIVLGIAVTAITGIEYGIDFQGGTEMAISFNKKIETDQIRTGLAKSGLEGLEIKSYGKENQFLFRSKETEKAQVILMEHLHKAFPNENIQILKIDKIGPKIGSELRNQAFLAVILSVIAILLYVSFRFEFVFGLGAIIALVHDVIITFTLSVIFNKLGILSLEVDQQVLAAMLTVVGFSINDTVIIFDRIRENREKHKGMNLIKLTNLSINETLSRTVNTVSTVLLTLLALQFFGGPVLQSFSFIMILGIVFGTYSSVYIASAFVIWYYENVRKMDLESGSHEMIDAPKA